jgi:hypothetical protein
MDERKAQSLATTQHACRAGLDELGRPGLATLPGGDPALLRF